jgi:hypothetical protein
MTRLFYFNTAKLNSHCIIEHPYEVFHDEVLDGSISCFFDANFRDFYLGDLCALEIANGGRVEFQ